MTRTDLVDFSRPINPYPYYYGDEVLNKKALGMRAENFFESVRVVRVSFESFKKF